MGKWIVQNKVTWLKENQFLDTVPKNMLRAVVANTPVSLKKM
jgi:hypothetical protein